MLLPTVAETICLGFCRDNLLLLAQEVVPRPLSERGPRESESFLPLPPLSLVTAEVTDGRWSLSLESSVKSSDRPPTEEAASGLVSVSPKKIFATLSFRGILKREKN